MNRRIGKFTIDAHFIKSYSSEAKRIFGMCTILKAEYQIWSDRFEYIAICDKFEELEDGQIPNEYQAIFFEDYPEFSKVSHD